MATERLEEMQETYQLRDRYPITIYPLPDDFGLIVGIPDLEIFVYHPEGRNIPEALQAARESARQTIMDLVEDEQPLPKAYRVPSPDLGAATSQTHKALWPEYFELHQYIEAFRPTATDRHVDPQKQARYEALLSKLRQLVLVSQHIANQSVQCNPKRSPV